MKALSVRPPWAYLIVGGFPILESVDIGEGRSVVEWHNKVVFKDVENRRYPTSFRGRICIHAGKHDDPKALDWLLHHGFHGFPAFISLMSLSKRLSCGAIIGEVDLVDCVTESNSPWFDKTLGGYGWVLKNPQCYERPIPCRGHLALFEVTSIVGGKEG